MSGRLEIDKIKRQWIDEHMDGCSDLLRGYMMSTKKKLTQDTRRMYLSYLKQYEKFMAEKKIKVTEVLPMHIDQYIDYLGETCGDKMINTKLSAVHSFYEYLIENELVTKNPTDKKKIQLKDQRKVIYMTEEEEKRLKESIKSGSGKWRNRDYAIVVIGLSTGLRVSEITNIDVEDIDFENMMIRNVVRKGKKTEDIMIGKNTVVAIVNWLIDRDLYARDIKEKALFISQKGNRLSNRTVQEMLQRETNKLGFDKHITPHKMRSTCATKLYNKTGDIYLVAQQLGHSNIKNTMIYAQANDDRKREAAAILD